MGAQHTPGPWTVPHFATSHSCSCKYVLAEAHLGAVATVHHNAEAGEFANQNPPFEEAKANARLIAAAPCMVSALRELVEAFTPWGGKTAKQEEALADAVDAIERATLSTNKE